MWLTLLLLVGCQTEFEGDDAYECSDAADNDRDGAFDCDDPDCFGSPDCVDLDDDDVDDDPNPTETETDTESPTDAVSTDSDEPSDTDAPSETEIDTDEGEAVAEKFLSAEFTYTLAIEFISAPVGLWDCSMTFDGSGSQVEASGNRVTFQGPWEETANDCSAYLAGIVWEDRSGEAFHHFFVDDDVTGVTDWFESDSVAVYDKDDSGWYITDMEDADIVDGVVSFELEEAAPEIYATLIHQLDITFSEE